RPGPEPPDRRGPRRQPDPAEPRPRAGVQGPAAAANLGKLRCTFQGAGNDSTDLSLQCGTLANLDEVTLRAARPARHDRSSPARRVRARTTPSRRGSRTPARAG